MSSLRGIHRSCHCVLLGDSGHGKSELAYMFRCGERNPERVRSTIGVDFVVRTIPDQCTQPFCPLGARASAPGAAAPAAGAASAASSSSSSSSSSLLRRVGAGSPYLANSLLVRVWDTAGQERYRATSASYYRMAECAFVVCSLAALDDALACDDPRTHTAGKTPVEARLEEDLGQLHDHNRVSSLCIVGVGTFFDCIQAHSRTPAPAPAPGPGPATSTAAPAPAPAAAAAAPAPAPTPRPTPVVAARAHMSEANFVGTPWPAVNAFRRFCRNHNFDYYLETSIDEPRRVFDDTAHVLMHAYASMCHRAKTVYGAAYALAITPDQDDDAVDSLRLTPVQPVHDNHECIC